MTIWNDASDLARAGRQRVLWEAMPWLGLGLVATLYVSVASNDSFVQSMVFLLSLTFAVLVVRTGYRRYRSYHTAHVVPMVLGHETPLVSDPEGGVSQLVLESSRLFPGMEKVRTQSYMRGAIGPWQVEVSFLETTRLKVLRKVRKIQVPIFTGIVFVFDLGHPVLPGDVVAYGPRVRYSRALSRARRGLLRQPFVVSNARIWGEWGTRSIWDEDSRAQLKALFKMMPGAMVSFYGGRHMVVAFPHGQKFIQPSGFLTKPMRDKRLLRLLDMMRAVTLLGASLGARQDRHYVFDRPVSPPSLGFVRQEPVVSRKEGVVSAASLVKQDVVPVVAGPSKLEGVSYKAGQLWNKSRSVRQPIISKVGPYWARARQEIRTTVDEGKELILQSRWVTDVLERWDSLRGKTADNQRDSDKDI